MPHTTDGVRAPEAPVVQAAPGSVGRLRAALDVRRPGRSGDAVVLVPLLVLTGVLLRTGLYGAPGRLDVEGQLATRAYDLTHLGPAADRSAGGSLSALMVAGWDAATGALGRAPDAVGAGRELSVVATLASAALLWALARRLDLPRAAAAVAVGLFALLPLAVQVHRALLSENLALPWVLAAFVLVLSPRRRLGAFVAASCCLVVAALITPAALLVLPVLAWLLWRGAEPGTRSYAVTVAGAPLLLAVAVVGVATAAGLRFGLADGAWSTTWPFPDPSDGARFAGTPSLVLVAFVAATQVALALTALRPFAVAALLLAVGASIGGPLLLPSVVTLLAIGAVLVAASATALWRRRPEHGRRFVAAAAVVAAVVLAAVSVPEWGRQLRPLLQPDASRPMTDAATWVAGNVPTADPVITDDVLWVDLVRQGRDPARVVRLGRSDDDRAAAAGANAAAPVAWLVSTDSIRSDPQRVALLESLTPRTSVAAAWGTGAERVEVRRVDGVPSAPQPAPAPAPAPQPEPQPAPSASDEATPAPTTAPTSGPTTEPTSDPRREAAARAGEQLSQNPTLTLSPAARAALVSGDVDPRLLVVLALATGAHELDVETITAASGGALHQMDVVAVDGSPVSADSAAVGRLRELLAAQRAPYDAQLTLGPRSTGTDVLTIAFPASP
ncbi:MAG TPA: hypothetical protein VF661_15015 [Actinomycetales bacterium]